MCKYIFHVINEISKDEVVRGKAPPHNSCLIGLAAGGVLKSICLKLANSLKIALFLRSRVSTCCSLTSWTRISRQTIQKNPRLRKAVTPQNQQQQLPRSNTEQRPPIARESFPVTSRSSDIATEETRTKPRAPRQRIGYFRENTTWNEMNVCYVFSSLNHAC